MYIRPRPEQARPFGEIDGDQAAIACAEENPQFAMISDWPHVTSDELYELEKATNIDMYCSQSILFNGQGRVNCLTEEQQRAALAPPFQALYNQGPLAGTFLSPSGCAPFIPFTQRPGQINPDGLPDTITQCSPTETDLHDFKVDPTKQFANIHLMSASSILAPVVSLDEHDMWVYAIDGRYIEPYKVQAIQIYNGDRYSVMIPLTKGNGTYTLRANHLGFNQLIGGFASVTYEAGSGATCAAHGGGSDDDGSNHGPRPGGYGGLGGPHSQYPHGNPNGNGGTQGLDCGIPGWKTNKPYVKRPDKEPEKAPTKPLPDVPTSYDWQGPMPGPDEPVKAPAYENKPPKSHVSPNINSTNSSPEPTAPQKGSSSTCTSEATKSAQSYVRRADQFRSTSWKRQSASSASAPWITYGGFPTSADVVQLNDSLIIPFPNVPPAQEVSATHIFSMSRTTAPWLWKVGGESYPSKPEEYAEDEPLLYFPTGTNANNNNLVIRTQNDTWVDLIFTVPDTFGPPHPMHKHSNKAYVIGRGIGNFTWNSVAEAAAAQPQNFNFVNPPLRDGYTTAPSAGQPVWLAIRYHVVNPGAFLLHCHQQNHLLGGMAVALLDDVEKVGEFPEEYRSVESTGL